MSEGGLVDEKKTTITFIAFLITSWNWKILRLFNAASDQLFSSPQLTQDPTFQFISWYFWIIDAFRFTLVNCFRISFTTAISGYIFAYNDVIMFVDILCSNYRIGPLAASISLLSYKSFPFKKQDLSSSYSQTSVDSNNHLPFISVLSLLLPSHTPEKPSTSAAWLIYPSISSVNASPSWILKLSSSPTYPEVVISVRYASPLAFFTFLLPVSFPSASTINFHIDYLC